ncbi:Lipin/Ned1/Smp2-domain-containing protein [Syncephalis plumigaleata]|nr:Lipin/Ned1/Smp2-domain-containing protein [Syncephalis plumigaleata]
MNFVTRALSSVTEFYKDLNPATLSGAIDVIVLEQPNGELSCTPFHVRFGKLRLLRPQDKVVEVRVNGELTDFQMKLGDQGEAFFVVASETPVPAEYTTSPIAGPMMMEDEPDFLDLEADTGYRSDHDDQDGYVSAHSAQESDLEPMTVETTVFTTKAGGLFHKKTQETEVRINLSKSDNTTPVMYKGLYNNSNTIVDVDASTHVENDPHLHATDGDLILDTKGYHNKEVKKHEWPMLDAQTRRALTTYESYTSPRQLEEQQVPSMDKEEEEEEEALSPSNDVFNERVMQKPASSQFRHLSEMNLKKNESETRIKEPTSDTELELHESSAHKGILPYQRSTSPLREDQWHWNWGQLPEKTGNDEWNDEPEVSKSVIYTPHSFTVDGVQHTFELSLCDIGELNEDEHYNEQLFNRHIIDYRTFEQHPALLYDHRMVVRYNGRYYSWMTAAPVIMSLLVFQRALPEETIVAFANGDLLPPALLEQQHRQQMQMQAQRQQQQKPQVEGSGGWRTWWSRTTSPPPQPSSSSSTVFPDSATSTGATSTGGAAAAPLAYPTPSRRVKKRSPVSYAKTLRLTSDQLTQLDLKPGTNTITFKVATGNAILSDIDGTITKSDALGHLFTMVGKDWTHPGVAKLYTDIVRNGYHIMYLTSRAIGQADSTRDYLRSVEQGQYQLPDGPVVMSPDRLFTSFHREVILRKPEVFKMACLRDIKRLFNGENPFYAGFGNRITDALSYRSVDVPASRIFTIDYNGDLRLSLNDIVDQIFPPVTTKLEDEYNDYNFWKAPLPDIELAALTKPSTSLPSSVKSANAINDKELSDTINRESMKASSLPVSSNSKRKSGSSRLGVIGSLVRMRSRRQIREEEPKPESDNEENASNYKTTSASNTAIDPSDKLIVDELMPHHTSYDQHSISEAIDDHQHQAPLDCQHNDDIEPSEEEEEEEEEINDSVPTNIDLSAFPY